MLNGDACLKALITFALRRFALRIFDLRIFDLRIEQLMAFVFKLD
jgi:hypothetical protein